MNTRQQQMQFEAQRFLRNVDSTEVNARTDKDALALKAFRIFSFYLISEINTEIMHLKLDKPDASVEALRSQAIENIRIRIQNVFYEFKMDYHYNHISKRLNGLIFKQGLKKIKHAELIAECWELAKPEIQAEDSQQNQINQSRYDSASVEAINVSASTEENPREEESEKVETLSIPTDSPNVQNPNNNILDTGETKEDLASEEDTWLDNLITAKNLEQIVAGLDKMVDGRTTAVAIHSHLSSRSTELFQDKNPNCLALKLITFIKLLESPDALVGNDKRLSYKKTLEEILKTYLNVWSQKSKREIRNIQDEIDGRFIVLYNLMALAGSLEEELDHINRTLTAKANKIDWGGDQSYETLAKKSSPSTAEKNVLALWEMKKAYDASIEAIRSTAKELQTTGELQLNVITKLETTEASLIQAATKAKQTINTNTIKNNFKKLLDSIKKMLGLETKLSTKETLEKVSQNGSGLFRRASKNINPDSSPEPLKEPGKRS